jgi:hypothetical protein
MLVYVLLAQGFQSASSAILSQEKFIIPSQCERHGEQSTESSTSVDGCISHVRTA